MKNILRQKKKVEYFFAKIGITKYSRTIAQTVPSPIWGNGYVNCKKIQPHTTSQYIENMVSIDLNGNELQ